MKQTTLALELDRGSTPPNEPAPEQRRRLIEMMAEVIVAVHRASKVSKHEEDVDDDARD